MKKTIYLVMGLIAALPVFNACNDQLFLTEEPKTVYTKENAFEKASQVDAALVRAYNKFNLMNSYNNGWAGGGDAASNFLHGDGADVLGGTRGSGATGGFNNYWSLQTNDGTLLGAWNSLYQLAAYANLVFDGLDVIKDIDPAEAKYLAAQANFLKGWAYLRLGELFGGVMIQERLSEELKFDYERTSRKETYDYAIDCLKAAVDDLPDYPKQSGRVAKGVANHFLAEALLARGIETDSKADYDAAITAANATIAAHPLVMERFGSRSEKGTQPAGIPDNGVPRYNPEGNVYWDLFQIGNYAYNPAGNTESLMIYVQPTYDLYSVNGGSRNVFGVTCGPAYRDATWSEEYQAENFAAGSTGGPWREHIDGKLFPGQQLGLHLTGSWGMIATMDYIDEDIWEGEFEDDIRNSQIVRWTPVVMDQKSPYYLQKTTKEMVADRAYHARVSCKYTTWDEWGWNLDHSSGMGVKYLYQYGRDWYIARSAETYLIRAEAKLRNGDAAGAADDLNAVRARAKATKMYTAGEVTLFTILDERARELDWEEMRWPTLMRMGKGGQDGPGSNDTMKRQLEKHSFGTEDIPVLAGKTFPEWTLFPIPFNVITLNKDLQIKNNYGWEKKN